jgi:pimeloyl-ACP methyl ester carboxylesterase
MSRRRLLLGLGGVAVAAFGGAACTQTGGILAPDGRGAAPQPTETSTPVAAVKNAGVKIHFEVEGSGPPLFLHHGFAGSIDGWRQFGYIDALKGTYRVIAIDARGHGKSDKPHDPAAYTMKLRTDDVVAVLDAVGVDQVHYWGYSMGGRTGFALLQRYPERVASFINGASAPTSPKRFEEQRIRRWAEALRTGDVQAIAASLNVPQSYVKLLLEGNDLEALAAAQLGLLSWNGVNASTLHVPSLHYAGDRDPFYRATKAASQAMPGAVFKSLPGLDHLTAFSRSEWALPLALKFLEDQGAL